MNGVENDFVSVVLSQKLFEKPQSIKAWIGVDEFNDTTPIERWMDGAPIEYENLNIKPDVSLTGCYGAQFLNQSQWTIVQCSDLALIICEYPQTEEQKKQSKILATELVQVGRKVKRKVGNRSYLISYEKFRFSEAVAFCESRSK